VPLTVQFCSAISVVANSREQCVVDHTKHTFRDGRYFSLLRGPLRFPVSKTIAAVCIYLTDDFSSCFTGVVRQGRVAPPLFLFMAATPAAHLVNAVFTSAPSCNTGKRIRWASDDHLIGGWVKRENFPGKNKSACQEATGIGCISLSESECYGE